MDFTSSHDRDGPKGAHGIYASLICLLLCVSGLVGVELCIPLCCPASFFSSGDPPVFPDPPPPGALQYVFLNGVVLGDVAKQGELSSHRCQQRLLLSIEGVQLVSHIFVSFVFGVRTPVAFNVVEWQ